MVFAGWRWVADDLRRGASATGGHLNDGQRETLRALADRLPEHGVILADEVGMGKTRIAVRLARSVAEAGGRVAVLIPPTLGFQWQEELRLGEVPNVPNVVRSLGQFLAAWSDPEDRDPWWFRRSVLMISHGFVNWRLGAATQPWRFQLLPLLAGLAKQSLDGTLPYGFRSMSARSDPWARAAAESIAEFCAQFPTPTVRARLEALGRETAWRAATFGESYSQGGEPRRLLQASVGLGLGEFDLVIVDEAHKSRGEDTGLSRLLEGTLLLSSGSRRLCMTATPVELGVADWDQSLARIGADDGARAAVRSTIAAYAEAVRRVRLGWRGGSAVRDAYAAAARDFETALDPFVLRRDKRSDGAVNLFRKVSTEAGGLDGYRWQHDVTVSPGDLDLGWRRAVCAAEALSFVAHGRDDLATKRLRLTFANGHGIAARLDASSASADDAESQPGDPAPPNDVADAATAPGAVSPSSVEGKRAARVSWWQSVIDLTARAPGARYDHPAILAAIDAIEGYDERREKVLVFGRFTSPMRTLVGLLNARAMLRALDAGTPWPQRRVAQDEVASADAAHRQLGRPGPFDVDATNALLGRRYAAIDRRRESLRASLFDLLLRGLPEVERDARSLAEVARRSGDDDRAVLAAAIDQLLGHDGASDGEAGHATAFSPEAVAEAFLQLQSALRERGEGDEDGDGTLDPVEAEALWRMFATRLREEYGTERGRFARLMAGGTSLPTRRALQLAFNRPESNPRVLVAQSLVGREGLNLHPACRVVVLLHPEWNPGVVEQQVGRVDRVGSRWSQMLDAAVFAGTRPLPRIEVRPVIFQGTYDAHQWAVLQERWDDLRAQLHGIVVPYGSRLSCTAEELVEVGKLDAAAPNFARRPAAIGLGPLAACRT